jgi:aryl-alcohol dehydrogenase-like predicted oxidoreductase
MAGRNTAGVQQRYSYLRPKAGWDFGQQLAANDDLLAYVKDTGITLLAYSPLLNGTYTDRTKTLMEQYVGPDSDVRLKVLDEVATEAWRHTKPGGLPLADERFAIGHPARGLDDGCAV